MKREGKTSLLAAILASVAGAPVLLGGCSSPPASSAMGSVTVPGGGRPVIAIGAENEYANVISQIGGVYTQVTSVLDNPNTDPHTFESSPQVANAIAGARLVVQNGLGYDGFMATIEDAAPSSDRSVIDVQHLLGKPDDTANPHLWYDPATMPKVAAAVARDLDGIDPAHASYFTANVAKFDTSLQPLSVALALFKQQHHGALVAVTEPVADYLLEAAGANVMTPFSLQAAIMNGTDPSPEDVTFEENLLRDHKVAVFVYNEQVTDSLTETFLQTARSAHVPVVGVYETMPTPGYDYQSWMYAEVQALQRAVADGTSTSKL